MLSLAHLHPEVYLDLDDTILKFIQDDANLKETNNLIDRVTKNQLYQQISLRNGNFDANPLIARLGNESDFETLRIYVAHKQMLSNIIFYEP
jgi:hypothetical protein